MPAVDIDRHAAHQAARHELAKPVYPETSLSQRFHEWVDELLYRLVEQGSALPGGWFTLTVLVILLLTAAVVAIRVARRTLGTHRGNDELVDSGRRSAAEHRAAAQSAVADGDWAAAIRHRLRAVACGLEEAGVLTPAPGRTADELARDAGACRPDIASELFRAATVFNDVTYGDRPGTSAAYRIIVDLDDYLRFRPSGVPAGHAPAPLDARAPLR